MKAQIFHGHSDSLPPSPPLCLAFCLFQKVRDSDITAEIVEQLKRAGPRISGIIEAHGEGDAGMLEALFKVCFCDALGLLFSCWVFVFGRRHHQCVPFASLSLSLFRLGSRVDYRSDESIRVCLSICSGPVSKVSPQMVYRCSSSER